MSNESLPTRFLHFPLPNPLSTSSEALVGERSSLELNLTSTEPTPPRPKTRRAPIRSEESETVARQGPVELDKTLKATLVANFEGARAQIINLTNKTKEMSDSFEYEREKLIETIQELGNQVKVLKKETEFQKESYRESLEEIEEKSERMAKQLTNTLIENACLREENCLLREDQVSLTARVKSLERKLGHLECDQPRVKQILKSLERREEGLKLQIKRLAQLEAQMTQETAGAPPSRRSSRTAEAHYESVTEKARAILRKEKINYVATKVKDTEGKYVKCGPESPRAVPVSTSHASTSTQQGPDPREEEEEILRSLFFPF